MPYKVSIELQFDAAHRLCEYKGKCHNLHGHTYFVIVEATCTDLVPPGFVVDFGVLKKVVKDWINEHWDHVTILWTEDPLARLLHDTGLFVFGMDREPTAEHMASYLFKIIDDRLPNTITLTQVSIKETPTSTAKYYVDTFITE